MKKIALVILGLSFVFCMPAFAKNADHHEKNKAAFSDNEDKEKETKKPGKEKQESAVFDENKKASIRAYLRDDRRRHCPPGLAKKKNGCLPPGQAKKYEVGGMLPSDHRALPAALLKRLGAPPEGMFYSMVDDDVVLASQATKKILDAVTLLSSME